MSSGADGRAGIRLRLGTRGSRLALAQAAMTEAAIEAAAPGTVVERVVIQTAGDKRPDLRFQDFSAGAEPIVDKGIFTKELENALRAGEIDAAVHSLKDVPTELDDGFVLSAALPRAPVEDVLVRREPGGLQRLAAGARVGTSSVRRQALLRWRRPDLEVDELRGNVPTRLRKLAESDALDAVVLARAGLIRLGYPVSDGGRMECDGLALHAEILDPTWFLPAASQGAVAIETWRPDDSLRALLARIDDPETSLRVRAERHFLHLLEAGCQTPIGILTEIDAGQLSLRAVVFDAPGSPPRETAASGPAEPPEAIAREAFGKL